jgi:hypothetical protein
MDTSLSRALTQLPKGALLRIPEGRGKGIAVFQGLAWVTQHNDPRDMVLAAGESLAFDRPGLAVVQALGPASVLVFDTQRYASATPAHAVGVAAPERPTSIDLHRQARHLRNAAIGAAAGRLADAIARAWLQLRARMWARV